MALLFDVPCFEIDNTNVANCWKVLLSSISQSHFIALDLEMSGIGKAGKTLPNNIEERYEILSEIVKERSIVSLGISTFNDCSSYKKSYPSKYNLNVRNFNILTKLAKTYFIDSDALEFLIEYGFDFNRQKENGIIYASGNEENEEISYSIRNLFQTITQKKKPIVVHNGFIDLIFLYQSFFAELPKTLKEFVRNLKIMFPGGIYDTKYITGCIFKQKRSFLQYIFYTRYSSVAFKIAKNVMQKQRRNLACYSKGYPYITLNFCKSRLIKTSISRDLMTRVLLTNSCENPPCLEYGSNGWCKNRTRCEESHNIDYIIDYFTIKLKCHNKLKNLIQLKYLCEQMDKKYHKVHPPNLSTSTMHNAGYDAFMTGFCFATCALDLSHSKFSFRNIAKYALECQNHLYLTGIYSSLFLTDEADFMIKHSSKKDACNGSS